MTIAPVPTFIEETCPACGGQQSTAPDGSPCIVCGGSGRWLRSPYDVRVSGELRDERDGYEFFGLEGNHGQR